MFSGVVITVEVEVFESLAVVVVGAENEVEVELVV